MPDLFFPGNHIEAKMIPALVSLKAVDNSVLYSLAKQFYSMEMVQKQTHK